LAHLRFDFNKNALQNLKTGEGRVEGRDQKNCEFRIANCGMGTAEGKGREANGEGVLQPRRLIDAMYQCAKIGYVVHLEYVITRLAAGALQYPPTATAR